MAQPMDRKGRYLVEGTEVLSFRLSLPPCEEGTEMEGFYQRIGERVETFCAERLRPWAEMEFERCEDPKKRFHFPPFFYRLETRLREDGDTIAVSMKAILGRRGSAKPLDEWERELIWSVREDCLLPPIPVKKAKEKVVPPEEE